MISLGIILFLNVMVALFILSIEGCQPARASQRGLMCAMLLKEMREIAADDPDAFDINNFEWRGYKYMCLGLTEKPVTIDWDWIEWGNRLHKICIKYKEDCLGSR